MVTDLMLDACQYKIEELSKELEDRERERTLEVKGLWDMVKERDLVIKDLTSKLEACEATHDQLVIRYNALLDSISFD